MLKKIMRPTSGSRLINLPRGERGQSFVELAISIVFLLTLLAAMIDLGWAFYTLISLRDAAQEAAVYASMCPNHPALIIDRLQKSASAPLDISDIPSDHIAVCVIDPDNPPTSCAAAPTLLPALGLSVRVEVWVDHEIRTPFVASFIGTTTYPLRVDVSDAILRDKDTVGCE
jgi:Flp pilus assembly protein TadG